MNAGVKTAQPCSVLNAVHKPCPRNASVRFSNASNSASKPLPRSNANNARLRRSNAHSAQHRHATPIIHGIAAVRFARIRDRD